MSLTQTLTPLSKPNAKPYTNPTKGVFDHRIRIWIHIESLWQADLTFIRK